MENIKKLILVVEDEKILNDTLEEVLMNAGFNVIKAFDGEDGLKLALSEHPDLVLLDLLMPKNDGLSMLKKLREDTWGKRANIIILTNVKETDKMAEGMMIGLDDLNNTYEYIIKTDWSLESIVGRIKQRLEREK